jgi:LacI family transcriptional regulator
MRETSVGNGSRRQLGAGRVTSRDVAAASGVSQSTVSRVLRGDPRVSPMARASVLDAVERLGYRLNVAARSLTTSRTETMGVVVADIANPFYPFLIGALHQEFEALGFSTLLFADAAGSEEPSDDPLRALLTQAVDGLVFASANLGSGLGEAARRRQLPVVFLVRHDGDERFDRVLADNAGGGRDVARLLTDLGHRRIAMISGPANTSTSQDRDRGFLEAIADAGLDPIAVRCRHGPYTHAWGFEATLEMLRGDERPTAIFCGNDVIAFGALDAAQELGLSVPGDVSIVGFNDIPIAGWRFVNLTTVRQPLKEMARAAAQMLVKRVESPDREPRTRVFPVELVYRGTAGQPPS